MWLCWSYLKMYNNQYKNKNKCALNIFNWGKKKCNSAAAQISRISIDNISEYDLSAIVAQLFTLAQKWFRSNVQKGNNIWFPYFVPSFPMILRPFFFFLTHTFRFCRIVFFFSSLMFIFGWNSKILVLIAHSQPFSFFFCLDIDHKNNIIATCKWFLSLQPKWKIKIYTW